MKPLLTTIIFLSTKQRWQHKLLMSVGHNYRKYVSNLINRLLYLWCLRLFVAPKISPAIPDVSCLRTYSTRFVSQPFLGCSKGFPHLRLELRARWFMKMLVTAQTLLAFWRQFGVNFCCANLARVWVTIQRANLARFLVTICRQLLSCKPCSSL